MNAMGPWPHDGPVSNAISSEHARLLRRAQRIAQLRHPNLVRMLPMPGGAGLAPTLTQGRRLSDFTPSGTFKRFQLEQVVRLLLDVLSGLSALHEDVEDGVGFVHGEVCPRHIYVADDGTARLVPLLSRHWLLEAATISNGYAAPEFLLSARVDPRADLFSVGVMLGEALTGKPLFPDPALDAVIARLLGGKLLPLLPTLENRWALSLCAIAERAISPYPELRFHTAVELSNAIGVAVAPHLAERAQDVWQTEAPTLVRVPRPAGAAFRTLTPLATVLDVEPGPDSLPQPIQVPRERSGVPRPAVQGRWLVALSAAAVGVLALSLRQAAKNEHHPLAAAPGQPHAAAFDSAAAVTSAAAASASAAASAAPLPSAAAGSPPTRAQDSKRQATPHRGDTKPPRGHEDYGI
jgi:hypothetical protein